jgi:hypothetical protein
MSCLHVHVCMHVRMYVCTYVCMCVPFSHLIARDGDVSQEHTQEYMVHVYMYASMPVCV